jgi:hypothetical protein
MKTKLLSEPVPQTELPSVPFFSTPQSSLQSRGALRGTMPVQ